MAELLKNKYTPELIEQLANAIQQTYPTFDSAHFISLVFDTEWQNKALKARMRHITICLNSLLPAHFIDAIDILQQVVTQNSDQFTGFEFMFFPDYVELYGQDDFDTAMHALAHFTPFASAEFAVRPFIIKAPQKTMRQMALWAQSNNLHHRRLASEGCRPRLPWAQALPEFKANPSAILPILENLKNDPSEYVRRSVANNLNDIAKDNPDITLKIAAQWLGKTSQTDKLVKHACRTLLKQAHPQALSLFRYPETHHIHFENFICEPSVRIGDKLAFGFSLVSKLDPDQAPALKHSQAIGLIRLEYALDFKLKNDQLSRKIFKISELDCKTHSKVVKKSHSFKRISTRTYYAGIHKLSILLNGKLLGQVEFELIK